MLPKLLRQRVKAMVDSLWWKRAKNIELEMQLIAARETARFCIDNLSLAACLPTKWALLDYALDNVTTDGLFLEAGVWRGQTINHIAARAPGKTVYGFDSFQGLPEDWRSGFGAGRFGEKPGYLPSVRDNVKLIAGWFRDTLPPFAATQTQPVAFAHIDCDLYSSTKEVLHSLRPLLRPKSVLLFDEFFNYPGWQAHEFKAFQEFVAEYRMKYNYLAFCGSDEQCAIMID